MTRIIIGADLESKLQSLTQPADLSDETGRVLGRFVPRVDLTEWEPLSPDVSEEELDRREQSNEKRYTTAEALASLEKL
jgi:hypothetical protein